MPKPTGIEHARTLFVAAVITRAIDDYVGNDAEVADYQISEYDRTTAQRFLMDPAGLEAFIALLGYKNINVIAIRQHAIALKTGYNRGKFLRRELFLNLQ